VETDRGREFGGDHSWSKPRVRPLSGHPVSRSRRTVSVALALRHDLHLSIAAVRVFSVNHFRQPENQFDPPLAIAR
jgi:hypothetical protein